MCACVCACARVLVTPPPSTVFCPCLIEDDKPRCVRCETDLSFFPIFRRFTRCVGVSVLLMVIGLSDPTTSSQVTGIHLQTGGFQGDDSLSGTLPRSHLWDVLSVTE